MPGLLLALALVPVGHVNDFAQILRPETVSRLETALTEFERTTGNEIAVVTISTRGPDETIESYAVTLFEKWGIGKEKEDNGILLLIARDDREVRIEVGYGLEPEVTDIESVAIIRENIVPAFRAGDYDKGVEDAVTKIIESIKSSAQPESASPFPWEDVIWLVIFLIIIFINIRRKRQGKSSVFPVFFGRRGGFNDKGGGFGGFGGGMSGGGGSSGRW